MNKTINIIIPAYNEENRLPETLAALGKYLHLKTSDFDIRTYIVNDGSRDKTRLVAHNLLAKYNIKGEVLDYGTNRGKGYAVKYGMLHSRPADYYYLSDADLSSPWETMMTLVGVLEKQPVYSAAIGSRAMPESRVEYVQSRHISGRISNLLINLFLNLGFKDTQCGYKLFNHECLAALKILTINRWGFDFELLYVMKKMGLRAKEVGIEWHNMEGSKVRFSDYFKTLEQLWRVRTTKYSV